MTGSLVAGGMCLIDRKNRSSSIYERENWVPMRTAILDSIETSSRRFIVKRKIRNFSPLRAFTRG